MIFGKLNFPGKRWYVVAVLDPQMVGLRNQKTFGNHWVKLSSWRFSDSWLKS